ncbi:hypothetical protein CONLIGDRAFT_205363 [Coniochaeta ligniaria NRRL 30616]|uniref:Serine/threonine-protein kinase Tel1 n=1 Tax=Coniochaeta ligniaria NRRL 30616 TaxID=1408157 RepID=A0A1J7JKV1_9PEZI|nr:hypothetical protein CONLIGDRAFT_205363 [Coniochaeta ligniaria NRRL 30616]
MAPFKRGGGGEVTLKSIEASLKSNVATERKDAIENLIFFFTKVDRRSQQPNQTLTGDDNYHSLFEALFQCTLLEKQSYFSAKKGSKAASSTRLENCAKALKVVVSHGAPKIKRKTARALVDHITQVLPGPDEDFVAPLLQDYTKAFLALLDHPANVENFAVLNGELWFSCVDFCVLAVSRFLEAGDRGSASLSRSSPAPGTGQTALSLAFSSGRSGSSSAQRLRGQATGQIGSAVASDYLSCLNTLLSTTHAPVQERADDVADLMLKILEMRQAKLGTLQQLAFACINGVLAHMSTDEISIGKRLARDLVPLISHWWPPQKRDAMTTTIRDEILKTLYAIHLFLDSLTHESPEDASLKDLEDLLDVLWSEYSRREDRGRLLVDDLTFTGLRLPTDHPKTGVFSLRPYNQIAEQNWALMEILAILESLYSRNTRRDIPQHGGEDEEQPRKRRRMVGDARGIMKNITSLDPGVRLTALQLLPFIFQQKKFSADEVAESLDVLLSLISDKQPSVASWAMLACSSVSLHHAARDITLLPLWKQVWQIGLRSISLAGQSRTACVLLHCILEADLIPKHEIMDDINIMITNSDISGPAVLVDSSLVLMLHLLGVRNTTSPNASQATSNHIIRWVFVRWNPEELHYSSQHSHLATPLDLINLMRACSGMTVLGITGTVQAFGGPIAQFRQGHKELHPMLRYLLLLEDAGMSSSDRMSYTCLASNDTGQVTDPTGSHTAKRLILELMFPKLEQLLELAGSWGKKGGEGASQISTEKLQSVILSCIAATLILPELKNLNSAMSRDLESLVFNLVDSCFKAVLESDQNDAYFDLLLASAAPYIPQLNTSDLRSLRDQNEFLLRYFAKLSECLEERLRRESLSQGVDAMEIDDDFLESQASSQRSSSSKSTGLPRRDTYLCHTPEAFYLDMRLRLRLLAIIHQDDGQLGLVPEVFLDELLALSTEQLLCCRMLMRQLFNSDLITAPDDATRVIETMGIILSTKDFSYCEAALCLVLEMMEAFIGLWTDDRLDIASMVGDLYNHFVKYALPKNELSPTVQAYLSKLLFRLLEVSPNYAAGLKLPSCRSTLLSILRDGAMRVKFVIGHDLPKIFSLYVLKAHDEIFVDILDSLPSDPKATEGIAFRLQVLAELACNWSTLLRRSVYHIFETPGRIDQAAKYAASCVRRISQSLGLDTPRELFRLFSPQLLYTWLESDSIETIPFEIFGFPALQDLLIQAQTEAAAIMIMRGQEQEALGLAEALGLTAPAMIRQGFTKIMAYSIAHDISVKNSPQHITGESRVRKLLGKEAFIELVYLNFADIVSTFFDIFDQEDPVEKLFRKDDGFSYAADIMDQIKQLGHLDTILPPNQQPMFKAKYLTRELEYLCSRTEYEPHAIWTPSLLVAVARKLLNTVHPALGPLHACSVLRKIRVLIALSGPQALTSYPLEMLLHSTRIFLKDPECADDALGVSRYLIQNGGHHLRQAPSFLAGYALSSLADLRVFLESSQSSTTQESQFKATINKAQQFHTWFSDFLSRYDSPAFKDDEQRQAFKSITQSAAHIRASGNADKGTPESSLLLEILKDDERESQLLNRPAREVALDMLCGVFTAPASSRSDVIENDEEALAHGAIVLKSCRSNKLSDDYLAWGGRVVGRSFLASGEIPLELLRESRLSEYRKLSSDNSGSEHGILNILEALTVSSDCITAGLAESALRTIVSEAVAEGDNGLLTACQKSLSESLLASCNWDQYRTPPSDYCEIKIKADGDALNAKLLESQSWPQRVAIHLAHSVPDIVVLSILPPILANVKGCAERAFPFIVHLVLLSQLDKQQGIKRQLSKALEEWLKVTSTAARENVKLLLNTILYLRTQRLPNETSIADRSHWLDVNFSAAAAAATRCGMFKVALLFAELAFSEVSRTSRRSSAAREVEDSSETLLEIFENIDDPDAYYGLTQDASLATVLARLEYENDGIKSLAFRGAQYDSHLRRRDSGTQHDGQQLIKSLTSVGLAGLSHSLLQAQQSLDGSSTSLDSTFTTARRLEVWNLPAPSNRDNYAVNLYKAYQTMHKAEDIASVREAIHDGLKHTIRLLSNQNLTASNLRHHLGALASLTELDDLTNITDKTELEAMLNSFSTRSKWMMSGRYGDVSQILSCRETSLSMFSQHHRLRAPNLSPAEARLGQIRGMLLSSDIYRFHRATQESLNLSTSLTDLIQPSEEMGLMVDAAIRMEAANSLWDHGEMISSVGMLQSIDRDSSLKKQTVPVNRSNLLSKIGHQVSVARLESPENIQKRYLEPALKELKGKSEGKEAGQVYHQFAMFCDEQLQNPDSLEDLARLQSLKKGKSDEVADLKSLIAQTTSSQLKSRYSTHLAKAKQWLDLDQQELRRVEQTRAEFVRLSLENYLLSLICSDEHNNDALRFTAMWLERSHEDATNEAVRKYLDKVPTRKFATLMNQLSSRLQDQRNLFQHLLFSLVLRICIDHPYHGMYQVWSGVRSRVNKQDEVALSRQKATEKVSNYLQKDKRVAAIWVAIDKTSKYYHSLAVDRDANRYKAGQKMPIKDSPVGAMFLSTFAKYPIPPPTMQIELSADMDYSRVPLIQKFEPNMSIASGVSAPKIITAIGSDGGRYKQLVKGGNDDLRQDAIMEQVFAAVSELLKLHRTTRQRNLGIRTYKVLPLTSSSGLIEFVSNTIPLHEYLMPAHERYYPKDLKGSNCRKEISNVQTKTIEVRLATYRKVTERFHPVMRYFFMEYFVDPDEWFVRRTAYTRSTAAVSILGHVLGLGDRHGHNILLDTKTGEAVHIDLGVAFEMGRILPVPELVPFRMTRDIVDGMGITKTEGVFRRCCEFTLDALREETYSIMTILDVLRYDPLYSWSMSPLRMAKLQNAARGTDDDNGDDASDVDGGGKKNAQVNEPSEADRALEVVRKKLSKTLSVTATVNDLINQATDEKNLAVLYSGWAAYA